MGTKIPDWTEYFFLLADIAASRSSCSRRQVGAVIVNDRHLISTGYNGTIAGSKNCNEGGCARCAGTAPTGMGYESCVCVHAEQNAIALAARHGTCTDGASIYLTAIEPCLSCLKSIVQAGIRDIYVGVDIGHDFQWSDAAYKQILVDADCSITVFPRQRLARSGG